MDAFTSLDPTFDKLIVEVLYHEFSLGDQENFVLGKTKRLLNKPSASTKDLYYDRIKFS